MAILGGRVVRLEAKRKSDKPVEGLNVNININKVEQDKKNVKIVYTSTTEYSPDVAEITVDGEIFWECPSDKEAKSVLDEFNKDRRLPDELAAEVVTAITYTYSAVGTLASFGLGLTAPINVPRARIVPKEEGEKQAS